MRVIEPLEVGGVRIEAVDYRGLSDEQIRLLHEFAGIMHDESTPEDPMPPLEVSIASVRSLPPYIVVHDYWGLDTDGRLAAEGYVYWSTSGDDNKHVVDVSIRVRPDCRRRGIARKLLGVLRDVSEGVDRTLMIGSTTDRVAAGEAFAARVGADAAFHVTQNRLLLADVDRGLVGSWVDEGPARAPGYELVTMDCPYPGDQVGAIADLMNVMNTAPRDDLDIEDHKWTVEEIRARERAMDAVGTQQWALFARQRSTGDLVGYTEVRYNPHQPKTMQQGDTGVLPEHRGHALGKWLKATMLERIFAGRPGVEDIRTGNANSNAPMLGINYAMGFKPYIAHTGWQVKLDRVRAYLAGSID